MSHKIEQILEKLGVTVLEVPELDAHGHYIAAINTIVLHARLNERERTKALLHELGHAAKHKNNYELYNLAFSLHSKMEREAEEFMIEQMVEIYLHETDFNFDSFSAINFLENHDLDLKFEPIVKESASYYFDLKGKHTFS